MKHEKQKRGRPRKSSEVAKSEGILLRLQPAEKQAFKEAAELSGAPLSVWIRERLRWATIKELETAGRSVAFLKNTPIG